ncbi:MAG: GGDEF domain-containing protein [Abyssibacter sp.]|nr:GGDEF domain-containing protein [Abyssibacter sp.]
MAAQIAATALSLLAVFLELVVVRPPHTAELPFLAVFAVGLPLTIAASAVYLRVNQSLRWLPVVSSGVILGAFAATFYLEAVYAQLGLEYRYQTTTFVLIFAFLLLGLRYFQAHVLAFVGLAGLVTTYWLIELPAALFAQKLYNYIAVATLASTAGYLQEYIVRSNFLDRGIRRHQALHDGLTGLLNRHGLDVHSDKTWRHARRHRTVVAVAVFDIDWFKPYNDELGHPAGDACLSRVGACLLQHTRRPLDSAARLGGEEFAVVWYEVNEQSAMKLANRFRMAVEALRIEHPAPCAEYVTVSGGVTVLAPASGRSLNAAILAADTALYEAKRNGRNRVHLAADVVREWPVESATGGAEA